MKKIVILIISIMVILMAAGCNDDANSTFQEKDMALVLCINL